MRGFEKLMQIWRKMASPLLWVMLLAFFVASCTSGRVVPDARTPEAKSIAAPKQMREITPPPSSDWIILESAKGGAISSSGLSLFSWNWKVVKENGQLRVVAAEYKRPNQNPPIPFDYELKTNGELRATLDLGISGHSSGLGTLWLLGYQGTEFSPFGSLWWLDSQGKASGPVVGGDTVALYRTEAGVVALQESKWFEVEGWGPDGRPTCFGNKYESTILLIRYWTDFLRPRIEHVMHIPGPIRRHLIQEDDSILVENIDSLWMVMPSGREMKKIMSRRNFEGAPRSVLATENGGALLLTTKGLWKVKLSSGEGRKIVDVDTCCTYPMQRYAPMFVADNGDIFLGLTFFLVRFAKKEDGYHEEWYVPAECPIVEEGIGGACTCKGADVQGKTSDCSQIGAVISH